MNNLFRSVYKDKTVLVTGHTGFKGSWLTIWLKSLGARVVGYSAYLPSNPCNFAVCDLGNRIAHIEGDIQNINLLRKVFSEYHPDVVFHLAAQSLVRKSYNEPKLTFDTNLGGTVNILECIRTTPSVKAAVIITSDKCYQNDEWLWGYRENDRLGGDDPYSASKACAEIACNAYIKSFFPRDGSPRISTTRAGNVIGGGDWAADRIIPDCVRAWSEGEEALIRNPLATRPWQHVFEPLSGYLWLGANLFRSKNLHGEAFNFGPDHKVNKSVGELIEALGTCWGSGRWRHEQIGAGKRENTLLKLSCDKALQLLNWHAVLSFNETVRLTAEWYNAFYEGNKDMYQYSLGQIQYYVSEAIKQDLSWAKGDVEL